MEIQKAETTPSNDGVHLDLPETKGWLKVEKNHDKIQTFQTKGTQQACKDFLVKYVALLNAEAARIGGQVRILGKLAIIPAGDAYTGFGDIQLIRPDGSYYSIDDLKEMTARNA